MTYGLGSASFPNAAGTVHFVRPCLGFRCRESVFPCASLVGSFASKEKLPHPDFELEEGKRRKMKKVFLSADKPDSFCLCTALPHPLE